MAILYCFSRQDFNKYMDIQNWTDETLPNDVAIISICCTEPVKENLVHAHYDGKTDFHRFADKENVLNLDFDDITEEIRHCEGGYDAIGITKEQADKAVKFIDAHKNSDFFIHCNAGKSRSQAFVKYIQEQYPDGQWLLNPNNPCLYPNVFVSNMLKRSAYNLFLGETMFADKLRQIQATRYKVDPEYFDQCIGYINRDLREAAKESDSRRFIYYIRDGEFVLYQRNEFYLPGDPCVLRVSEKMIPKLQEYYKKEGIKVTCQVRPSDYTKMLEFSW